MTARSNLILWAKSLIKAGSYITPLGTSLVPLINSADGRIVGYCTAAELQNLGITAGAGAASRAVVLDANGDFASFRHLSLTGNLRKSWASVAAAGANQGNAAALTADNNYVTAADDAKGVVLPAPSGLFGEAIRVINSVTNKKLLVYPATGGAIGAIAANGAITLLPGETMDFLGVSATQWHTNGFNRIASGVQTSVAAVDTIVTGLRTVRVCGATYQTDPADANTFVSASIGDQAGTPAAGSILLKTWKTADGADVTPAAATTFSKAVNWWAIGS